MPDTSDLLPQTDELHPEHTMPEGLDPNSLSQELKAKDISDWTSHDWAEAINSRATDFLGVQNLHAPFPGVAQFFKHPDKEELIETYIKAFDSSSLTEIPRYHHYKLTHSVVDFALIREQMRAYVKSDQFVADCHKIDEAKALGYGMVAIGGNMVERILPLAYLHGLPVYQKVPVTRVNSGTAEFFAEELTENLTTFDKAVTSIQQNISAGTHNKFCFVNFGIPASDINYKIEAVDKNERPQMLFASKELELALWMSRNINAPSIMANKVAMIYMPPTDVPPSVDAYYSGRIPGFEYKEDLTKKPDFYDARYHINMMMYRAGDEMKALQNLAKHYGVDIHGLDESRAYSAIINKMGNKLPAVDTEVLQNFNVDIKNPDEIVYLSVMGLWQHVNTINPETRGQAYLRDTIQLALDYYRDPKGGVEHIVKESKELIEKYSKGIE